MYAEITAAVQSTKTLVEIIKSAKDLSNHAELLIAVNAVQEKLSQALVANIESAEKISSLSEEVRSLKEKIDSIENWNTEISRYELHSFEPGTFAYSLKQGMEAGEPHHYLCANCAQTKVKSILQPSGLYLRCPKCETQIQQKHSPPYQPPRRPTDWRL